MLATLMALAVAAVLAGVLLGGDFLRGSSFSASTSPSGPASTTLKPAAQIDAVGQLVLPMGGGLSQLGLPSREGRQLVAPARSGAVTSARWSPDGTLAAYAWYHVRPGDSAASSEIYTIGSTGESGVLVERDQPGAVLESPAWTPDGRAILYSRTALENQRVAQRIERFDLDTGQRSPVTEGIMPDVSRDGARLAFVVPGRDGDALVVAAVDGSAASTVIAAGRFSVLGPPRFSPDGLTLAFTASQPLPTTPVTNPPRGLLDPPVAYAHGDPWEVYLLELASGDVRRLTNINEDEVTLAWSPDGSQLAVFGLRGLFLVDLSGRTTFALDQGSYGGIDWAP